MSLQQIVLTNYRNLTLSIDLNPRGNLIIAPNGSGKSNFLESIYILAFARCFRPIENYAEIIGPVEAFAKASLKFDQQQVEVIVSDAERLQRRFLVNSKVVPTSKLVGRFPVILFAPHAVDIATGDPGIRRDDLNDFLSIVNTKYAPVLSRYLQVLKNRNALLKNLRDTNGDPQELGFWTDEIVKVATELFGMRYDFFSQIEPFLQSQAESLYNDTVKFEINYLPNTGIHPDNYEQELRAKFEENQAKEMIVGQTLYGPHKDDYQLVLNGKNLRFLGSRGQQRIATFIWKLAQHEFLLDRKEISALFLIDDLMSELDNKHREKIAELLINKPADFQYIITGAVDSDIPQELQDECQQIELNGINEPLP